MVALAIVLCAVVALLAVLVAGLLRSHADILKALHDLGVGVGDPATAVPAPGRRRSSNGSANAANAANVQSALPLTVGPPLPGERDSVSAPAIGGSTPGGDALAISPGESGGLTLLGFLSSGCATCAGFWGALADPRQLSLIEGVRTVVVTKGPEFEIQAEVRSLAPSGVPVVMSSEAWSDYEVPGSPFFVLVDGDHGRRIGEGVAQNFTQIADLVRRARAEREPVPARTSGRPSPPGLDGPERERANDRELLAAGILPGDPSLYPTSLEDVFEPDRSGGLADARADQARDTF
jgi:hypothetical protein